MFVPSPQVSQREKKIDHPILLIYTEGPLKRTISSGDGVKATCHWLTNISYGPLMRLRLRLAVAHTHLRTQHVTNFDALHTKCLIAQMTFLKRGIVLVLNLNFFLLTVSKLSPTKLFYREKLVYCLSTCLKISLKI